MSNLIDIQPIKTIHDKRLAYLTALAKMYRDEGYYVKVTGHNDILEIYSKETDLCQETSCTNLRSDFDDWMGQEKCR